MTNNFAYFQLTKIIFGAGQIRHIPSLVEPYAGEKILVISDPNISKLDFFSETVGLLKEKGFDCVVFNEVEPNPAIETCDKAAALARNNCAAVISIGGGSVIDVGKSVALLVTNPGSIKEYLLGYPTPPKCVNAPDLESRSEMALTTLCVSSP